MNMNQNNGSFYGQQNQYGQQPQQQFNQQQQQQGSFYGGGQQQQQNGYGQQQQQNGYGSQQQVNPMNGGGGAEESKWKKAHDPNSNKDYWYHIETKETTWTMPAELAQQAQQGMNGNSLNAQQDQQQKRMSAQMAVNSGSVIHFDAAWGSDSDDDGDGNGDDSWDEDKDDSSSDDGLDVYDPNKIQKQVQGNTLVNDDPSDSEEDDQKPHNPLSDDEEVLVADTSSKYWNIGESEGQKYPLSAYADKYFQKKKHGGMFKSTGVAALLRYAPYKKVKHALKKVDAKLDKQAQQTWKNVNSYMGLRKSSKGSSGHVEKLLRFALKAPEA